MDGTDARTYWGAIFVTLGATFAAAGLTFWFAWGFPTEGQMNQVVLGIVVHVLFGYIVVSSGIAIYQSDMSPTECRTAGQWCFGGFALMAALVVWRWAPELAGGGVGLEFLNQVVVVGSVGAAAGVLIGLNRGQAQQNARLVAEKDDQRDTLAFVLELLRHDVRNDLMAIGGFADLLGERVDDETDLEYVEHIQRRTDETQRLLETVDAVLQSEASEHELERIDLGIALRDQVATLRETSAATVEADVPEDLHVHADSFIDELFRNVLSNAVVHNDAEDLNVAVTAQKENGEVRVLVEDDGAGIPEDIVDEVFEPGVQRSGSNGDGLGLYLTQKLVTAYGGTISAETRKPSGTRFTIRLPAA